MWYIVVLIAVVAYIIISFRNNNDAEDKWQSEPGDDKPQRQPLTPEEKEAIRQADEVFDWDTHNAIVNGTYDGLLPEYDLGRWSDIYPDIYRTKIAGINYCRGIKDLSGITFDARIVAEPNNKYDKNAIRIEHAQDGRKLGYIPASETDYVRQFLNDKLPHQCRVHIDEFEEWDDEKERDVTLLCGTIAIHRKAPNSPNVSPYQI